MLIGQHTPGNAAQAVPEIVAPSEMEPEEEELVGILEDLEIRGSDTSGDPMETAVSLLESTSIALTTAYQDESEDSDCSRDEPVVVPSWYRGEGSPWLPETDESVRGTRRVDGVLRKIFKSQTRHPGMGGADMQMGSGESH